MTKSSREVAAISERFDASAEIVVCVPSFRRAEHLQLTLASLARQRFARRFAVVVVENDAANRAAVPVAAQAFRRGPLQGLCVVEEAQGNCRAINAAFETALERFPAATMLLMIDDDEIASSDWLRRMVEAAETSGAGVVGGPVLPHFSDDLKQGLRRHPAFCPAYDRSGPVPIIYGSGNCLIRRSVFAALAEPQFDLRFNFLGGGDTDFFTRCRRAGLTFYWAADAIISETVPEVRTTPRWLMTRGLRIGAINYHVECKAAHTAGSRLRLCGKTLARLPLSLFRAGRLAMTDQPLPIVMHPMIVAAGSVLAAIGIEPRPYEASKIAS